jgi:hypothetical protein
MYSPPSVRCETITPEIHPKVQTNPPSLYTVEKNTCEQLKREIAVKEPSRVLGKPNYNSISHSPRTLSSSSHELISSVASRIGLVILLPCTPRNNTLFNYLLTQNRVVHHTVPAGSASIIAPSSTEYTVQSRLGPFGRQSISRSIRLRNSDCTEGFVGGSM